MIIIIIIIADRQTDWLTDVSLLQLFHYSFSFLRVFHFIRVRCDFLYLVRCTLWTMFSCSSVRFYFFLLPIISSRGEWHSSFCHVRCDTKNTKRKNFSELSLGIWNGLYAFNSLISLLHLNEPSIWPFGVWTFSFDTSISWCFFFVFFFSLS